MNESTYERVCRDRCPEGCGRSLAVELIGFKKQRGHFALDGFGVRKSAFACTAPTKDQFIEELAAQLAAAKKDTERISHTASQLLDFMETCHQCGAKLLLDSSGPFYCHQHCTADCSEHDAPDCEPLEFYVKNLREHIKPEQRRANEPA